jgi:ribulose-phosphate 3-epimerase
MVSLPVVPAIIPRSAAALAESASVLSFSLELHVDVVDGVFVPHTSWPYLPAGDPLEITSVTDRFTLEVDLMVHEPLPAAGKWIAAGADMLVFHVETIPLDVFRTFTETAKVTVGVSAHLSTPDELLFSYLPYADYVQVMGISEIGAQGKSFDERALTRIMAIRSRAPELLVSVDGSVNRDTLPRLKEAGARRFIVGSALVAAPDPAVAHYALSLLA